MIEEFEQIRLARVAYWAVILTFLVAALVTGKELLIPFVIALVVSYIIKALNDWIGRFKIGGRPVAKWFRASLALVIIIGALFGIGEILTYNIELMTAAWPQYQVNIKVFLQNAEVHLGMEDLEKDLRGRFQNFDVRPVLTTVVSSATTAIGDFFIIIIYILFLLLENHIFDRKLQAIHLNDPGNHARIMRLLIDINKSIRDYVVLKTIVSFITGFLSYWILVFIGVDFPMFWAFLIFILNYIPNIGSLIATTFPALISLVQFGTIGPFLLVLAGVGSVQVIVGNFVEPKIMGTSLNLSPLAVILSLTFWGFIWGVVGMILAVPIMVILAIILAQFPSTRMIAILLSEKGVISDPLDQEK